MISKSLKLAVGFALGALLAGLCLMQHPRVVSAQDATYGPKVYKDQGGDRENVASGGSIKVYSGGTIDASAGTLTLAAGQIAAASLASDSAGFAKVTGGVGSIAASSVSWVVPGAYVSVSTSASSTSSLCFKGAYSTLPTTGVAEGCVAYQLSDHTLYVATTTVVNSLCWKAAW